MAAKIFVFVFSRKFREFISFAIREIFLQFRENFAKPEIEINIIIILMNFVKWKKCVLKFIVKIYCEVTFSWKLKLKSTYCEYVSTVHYSTYIQHNNCPLNP